MAAAVALTAVVLVACGDGSSDGPPAAGSGPVALSGTITVSAATSLTAAFEQLADDFEDEHPGVDVVPAFGASSANAAQVLDGAPADVFASADEPNMDRLVDAGLVDEPVVFARNRLVLVTKPGNPEGIAALADLVEVAEHGVISLCGEEVPCGRYAGELLAAEGVTIPETRITRGHNVGATLTAVTEGDAVAAIVYVTDAATAGDAVEAIDLPGAADLLATYPIAVIRSTGERDVADAFVAYVRGEHGRAVLEEHGFLPPA